MSGHRASPAVPPANVSSIVLTGFMGAGKTTVGGLLAERLGWQFIDTDRLVEERAGMTVAEVFERRGEADFREMEAAVIREMAAGEHRVIALGGGAVERAETRRFLAGLPGCRVIFLDAPLDTLLGRCAEDAGGPVRPVLRDRSKLAERWQSRLPWYRAAHLTIATAGRTPPAVVEQVLTALDEGGGLPSGRAAVVRGVSA